MQKSMSSELLCIFLLFCSACFTCGGNEESDVYKYSSLDFLLNDLSFIKPLMESNLTRTMTTCESQVVGSCQLSYSQN